MIETMWTVDARCRHAAVMIGIRRRLRGDDSIHCMTTCRRPPASGGLQLLSNDRHSMDRMRASWCWVARSPTVTSNRKLLHNSFDVHIRQKSTIAIVLLNSGYRIIWEDQPTNHGWRKLGTVCLQNSRTVCEESYVKIHVWSCVSFVKIHSSVWVFQ